MCKVSVLILTKNEERDLPGCLQSLAWSDDVHVFDSGSSDRTVEIAERFGARVTVRTYENNDVPFGGDESSHRNWGLDNIAFRYPWVFIIDADERATPELAESVKAAVALPGDHVAFRVRRRDFYLGTWLKHVQASPLYMRLIVPTRVRYERLINPVSVADGIVGDLRGYLDHFPFSKGIDHWVSRHNGYSRFEAQQILACRQSGRRVEVIKAFTEKNFHQRRFFQKELFYRLPFRPVVRFLLLYVVKRGFLDGRAGLTYALLQAVYEYLIVLKVRELEAVNDGLRAAQ